MIKLTTVFSAIIFYYSFSFASTSSCSATAVCKFGTATCAAEGQPSNMCNPNGGSPNATCWQDAECKEQGLALKCSSVYTVLWQGANKSQVYPESATYVCCSASGSALVINNSDDLKNCVGH